jgi:hypothetical protein
VIVQNYLSAPRATPSWVGITFFAALIVISLERFSKAPLHVCALAPPCLTFELELGRSPFVAPKWGEVTSKQ